MADEKNLQTFRAFISGEVATLLGTPGTGVDPDASLMDIGVDSLMIVQLVNVIRSRLGTEVRIVDLFMNPTINGLAKVVHEKAGEVK